MKKLLPLFMIIMMIFALTGCKSLNEPECGLFYGDSLELYLEQKVYSCDSTWFCLDSIVTDTRNLTDSTGELIIALSYQINKIEFHQQFSTSDTWIETPEFTGYRFSLIETRTAIFPGTEYYLNVYDIYPDQAINTALLNNRYRLSCIFVRDIEG